MAVDRTEKMTDLELRQAGKHDCKLIFGWRNTPFIIANSSSRREVSWDEHQKWFDKALASDNHIILVLLIGGEPAGLARFNRGNTAHAVISVYLLEDYTGKGCGIEAIQKACEICQQAWGMAIQADVRSDNQSGKRAFERAGFKIADKVNALDGHISYVLNVSDRAGRYSWIADDDRNRDYYDQRVQQYGNDPRAADWGSQESQRLRFQVLASTGSMEGCSVLDVGCGTGEFLAWLMEKNVQVDYTGIDISPGMVETAGIRFPSARFLEGSVSDLGGKLSRQFDHVFSSGIFTYRREKPGQFLHHAVAQMYSACLMSLAFNALSGWGDEKEKGEFYPDPLETLEYCRTLTPWVTLRHDYHSRDFTIYMYRNRKA